MLYFFYLKKETTTGRSLSSLWGRFNIDDSRSIFTNGPYLWREEKIYINPHIFHCSRNKWSLVQRSLSLIMKCAAFGWWELAICLSKVTPQEHQGPRSKTLRAVWALQGCGRELCSETKRCRHAHPDHISAREVLTYTILFIPKSPPEYIHQTHRTFVAVGYRTRAGKISLSGDLSSGCVIGIVDDGAIFLDFRDSHSP